MAPSLEMKIIKQDPSTARDLTARSQNLQGWYAMQRYFSLSKSQELFASLSRPSCNAL